MGNSVSNRALNSRSDIPGETTEVTFRVTRGQSADTPVLTLRVNGDAIDTETVDIGPGESADVSFEIVIEDEGEYTIDATVSGAESTSDEIADGYDFGVFWTNADATIENVYIPSFNQPVMADEEFYFIVEVDCHGVGSCDDMEIAATANGQTQTFDYEQNFTDYRAFVYLTLPEGEHTVTFDHRFKGEADAVADTETYTVDAIVDEADDPDPEPRMVTSNYRISSTDIAVGDTITASVDVANEGNATGTYTSELQAYVNISGRGGVVSEQSVSISPGESVTIEHTYRVDEMGRIGFTLNGRSLDVVEVGDPLSMDLFAIGDCGVDAPEPIRDTETVDVFAVVESASFDEATVTVEWSVGPFSTTDTQRVPDGGDAEFSGSLTIDPTEIGGGDVDVSVGVVDVTS